MSTEGEAGSASACPTVHIVGQVIACLHAPGPHDGPHEYRPEMYRPRDPVSAPEPRSTPGPSTGTPEPSQAASEAHGGEVARLRKALVELADDFESEVDWSDGRNNYGDNEAWTAAAQRVRAVLASVDAPAPDEARCARHAGGPKVRCIWCDVAQDNLRRATVRYEGQTSDRDPADYGPSGPDDADPDETVCRTCGRVATEHRQGRFSIYGICPAPTEVEHQQDVDLLGRLVLTRGSHHPLTEHVRRYVDGHLTQGETTA